MDGGNEQRVAIKFCFKAGLSATETPVLVQKAYGIEAVNRWNVLRWYSWFWDGRQLVEDDERGGRPKSTRTEVNTDAVADLVTNGRRIASRMMAGSLNIPRDCSSSDTEWGFGKDNVVCTFCSTLLDTWAKGRSSRILPRHYRDGRCRQSFFLTKYLRDMRRSGVLPVTPKQSVRVLNGLVRHALGRRNLNSKRSRIKIRLILFSTLKA